MGLSKRAKCGYTYTEVFVHFWVWQSVFGVLLFGCWLLAVTIACDIGVGIGIGIQNPTAGRKVEERLHLVTFDANASAKEI